MINEKENLIPYTPPCNETIKDYVTFSTSTITVCTINDYRETTRKPIKAERVTMEGILYGGIRGAIAGLVDAKCNGFLTDTAFRTIVFSAATQAEFTALRLIPNIQSYTSIYLPIKNFFGI